jgi:hypothetical protein
VTTRQNCDVGPTPDATLYRSLDDVALAIGITEPQARQRLRGLRAKYGVPVGLRTRDDWDEFVHVSEVEFLRLPNQAFLPRTPPPQLWHLAPPAPPAPVVADSPRPDDPPPTPLSAAEAAQEPRMCIKCLKTRTVSRFPQKNYDVCELCEPARHAKIDLLKRAFRGGSPGLGRK